MVSNKKMPSFHETVFRSIAKAATFRILAIMLDSAIIYLITRRLDFTASIVILSNFSSTIAYLLHERAWNWIGYGKKKSSYRHRH